MKNILIFGDSNTYGLIADGSGRYPLGVRYPSIVQEQLGSDYHIIEEGCPGRTTIFNDPLRYHLKATDYLFPCLYSHLPLDLMVIMLGTNDCKICFHNSAQDIKEGLKEVVNQVKKYSENKVPILIMSPPALGDDIGLDTFDEDFNNEGLEVSKQLAKVYQQLALEEDLYFFDAALHAKVSVVDQEHMDEANHLNLGKELAKYIKTII